MSRNLGTAIRLTIESKMNNRKVIHNGKMGVYEDYTPVKIADVKGLEKAIKELYTYLVTNTKHKVVLHTYGVEVQTGENFDNIGQSFIGYDESLDSKLRLCYCNDTFLAMELMGIMQDFTGNKPLTKVVKGLQQGEESNVSPTKEEPVEGTLEELVANTEEYQDYGWGEDGRDSILSMLYNRLDKLCARLESQPEVTAKNVQEFRAEVKKVIKENEGILTKGMPLTKGAPVYEMLSDLLEQLSKVYPYLRAHQEKSNLLMETSNGEISLNVYDRELGKDRYKGVGNVMITVNTPVHKGFRKVLDFLSSNVSYARISGENESFTEKEDKKQVKTQEDKKEEVKEEVKQEVSNKEVVKSNEQDDMEEQYFNIYLTKAGSWGKKDDEYVKLKGIIEGLIREKDIDGVTLRGLDDTEVFIDWVINNETYTMALTKKATKVNELGMKYDMAIAYDTEYPDIVGVLIEDKLNVVFDKLDK